MFLYMLQRNTLLQNIDSLHSMVLYVGRYATVAAAAMHPATKGRRRSKHVFGKTFQKPLIRTQNFYTIFNTICKDTLVDNQKSKSRPEV